MHREGDYTLAEMVLKATNMENDHRMRRTTLGTPLIPPIECNSAQAMGLMGTQYGDEAEGAGAEIAMPAMAMSYQPQQWRPPPKPYQPLGPAHVPDGADEAARLAADRSERQDAWIRDQNCHRCGGKGHFQRECPTKKRDQVATEPTDSNRPRYGGRGGYQN